MALACASFRIALIRVDSFIPSTALIFSPLLRDNMKEPVDLEQNAVSRPFPVEMPAYRFIIPVLRPV
jgi:hypothetical protein